MNERALNRQNSSGYSLLELLIAMTLGAFVTAGLLTTLMNVYQTNLSSGKSTTTNDNLMLAMNLLTQTIQAGGYIPDPATGSASNEMPASPSNTPYSTTGQFISGTSGSNGSSDTLSVRYVTGLINGQAGQQDSQLNCLGRGIPITATNPTAYYIFDQTIGADSNGNLTCTYTGESFNPTSQTTTVNEATQTYTLLGASNSSMLKSLNFLYGVDTNADGSADGYYTAAQVPNWGNVISVQATLVFNNPNAALAGQPATYTISKIIPLMSRP